MSSRATQPLDYRPSFWKPVLDEHEQLSNGNAAAVPEPESAISEQQAYLPDAVRRHDLCNHCGAEFVVDSPYCRMCGKRNVDSITTSAVSKLRALDPLWLQKKLGLGTGSLISLFVGLVCMTVAAVVGSLYTASTYTDWQAIQTWRIEWLAAAGAAFLCGILLKRR